jgi:transcriptional regulator with XRE-family HTH domain
VTDSVLSERLRSARAWLNLPAVFVADQLQITGEQLIDLECGDAVPGDEMLARFAALYRHPVSWLRGDDSELHVDDHPGLRERLAELDAEGDLIEIARFAMFLRHHGAPATTP